MCREIEGLILPMLTLFCYNFLLIQNWCREFQKWLGSERLKVYGVSSDKKVEVCTYT